MPHRAIDLPVSSTGRRGPHRPRRPLFCGPLFPRIGRVARFLIVGAGDHALALAGALEREGHVLSSVARTDRGALEHVAIVCWLEGTSPERFLLGSVDSSMRGFLYQVGKKEREVLETAALNSIPVAVLTTDPRRVEAWLADAQCAIGELLSGER